MPERCAICNGYPASKRAACREPGQVKTPGVALVSNTPTRQKRPRVRQDQSRAPPERKYRMAACMQCQRANVRVAHAERDLTLLARRAARDPSPANVERVETARETLRDTRSAYQSHLASCAMGPPPGVPA